MKLRFLRLPVLVGVLLIACSADDDDDEGCNIGERTCSTDADCAGFTPPDFTILGPQLDARCFRTECVAEKCNATPIPGRVEDDADGDCQRSSCDEEGRLVRTPDRGDPPSRDDLAPCERSVCEEGLFGGLAPVTRPAPEGTSCFVAGEPGTCTVGRCVPDSEIGSDDGAADAASDSSTDAALDSEADGSTDAATD